MPKLAVLLAALVLALVMVTLTAAAPIAHTDWRDLALRALAPPAKVEVCPRPVVKSLRGRRVVIAEMPVRPGGVARTCAPAPIASPKTTVAVRRRALQMAPGS
ncbi:uncharacterized protein LOC62_02G003413 [Vanrija pseudolonga]|uniref:Uncharacterized protein n=1 Tax=Vanrija pseudolonga TaxID=143232 RepID=A0AAF0Y4F1_9TREE|nr:hypothetical protein LOC62_02G003413 [Vanrija pseudolonga]